MPRAASLIPGTFRCTCVPLCHFSDGRSRTLSRFEDVAHSTPGVSLNAVSSVPVPEVLTAPARSLLGRPRFQARALGPRAPRAAARAGKAYPIQGTLRTVGHGHGHGHARAKRVQGHSPRITQSERARGRRGARARVPGSFCGVCGEQARARARVVLVLNGNGRRPRRFFSWVLASLADRALLVPKTD